MLRNALALVACRALQAAGLAQRDGKFFSAGARASCSQETDREAGASSVPSESLPAQTVDDGSVCPTTCSFDGPWITAYRWAPVVGESTATVTVLTVVHRRQTLDLQRTNYAVETVYPDLPNGFTIPEVDTAGYVVSTASASGADGLPTETVLTYPTDLFEYDSTYSVGGPNVGSCSGASRTLPSHPTYIDPSSRAAVGDDLGSNYSLEPKTYIDIEFLHSAFPDVQDFRLCSEPTTTPILRTLHAKPQRPVLATTHMTTTYCGPQILVPHIEHSVGPGDEDDTGTYTGDVYGIFTAHIENSVPDDGGGATTVPVAQSERLGGAYPTGQANHPGGYGNNGGGYGGHGHGSHGAGWGHPQGSGADDGSAGSAGDGGVVYSANASPGAGAGGVAPQASSQTDAHAVAGPAATPTDQRGSDATNPTANGAVLNGDGIVATGTTQENAPSAEDTGAASAALPSPTSGNDGGEGGSGAEVSNGTIAEQQPNAARTARDLKGFWFASCRAIVPWFSLVGATIVFTLTAL